MDLGLQGKVFIVTGGAKGIGEAISKLIAAEGGSVMIAGRSQADNQKTVDAIVAAGGKAAAVTAELGNPDDCKKVVAAAVESYGKIDGLINNAGANDGVGLENGSPEKFMQSLQHNLSHYYNLAHYALPYLKATKGNIVNIGSKVATTGQGNTSGYAASKGAINALTREWAVELLPFGIRVNTVIPAEVWTPLYETWINSLPDPAEKLAAITSKIPFEKRMTTSEEIANTTVFLLSGRSSHTTGQILYVDGGYTHLDRSIS
ncbi:L-fucose dehydrogenase [Chitinophaga terrae (ex Kim and Jung 2007)]|jgi:L-fucose dehydrogenase|uniref:L-fucose dehydrogenase n=1 Tax=Chitinophaga terrae (ex Kim and Jung 2007) TaxID=408074 RepID=A0A1H4FY38_9BACT|nr:SDR family oxidoreductase [Chitinophaga terrae (ex Kim and Jung 2007)]MDQ0108198.1 L-fucose dehydrogenase [Chitinophaga terrae (ex Kim and Jung 2007)]GEP92788.1 short-chain dehydrogenase [Chitinophaga terrae (ex Kim and Jung 2007)]SEB01412.1 L-fucose dehydrogenase [Chitinophaga terrae (ex Kim and Jung 2007)]